MTGTAADQNDALDDALEELFDEPATSPPQPSSPQPSSPQPSRTTLPVVPATPEASPKRQPRKSILEHLVANQDRLSAGAAKIAADLRKLTDAAATSRTDDASASATVAPALQRDGSNASNIPSIGRAMVQRRAPQRKAPTKNAFSVIGKERRRLGSAHDMPKYAYIDQRITNMSIVESAYTQARLVAIFEHTPRLDIADIKPRYEDLRSGSLRDYAVFGCLVRKHAKRQAKNGQMYAIWSLCNMPRGKLEGRDVKSTVVRVLLFDEAYEAFHTQCEGTVFALRRPSLLPARESDAADGGLSPHALRVSRRENVEVLGVCKDFRLCEARRTDGNPCGVWYDANLMTRCTTHSRKRLRGLMTGTRMDIQNAIRPTPRNPASNIHPPADISATAELQDVDDDEESKALQRQKRDEREAARKMMQGHRGRTSVAGAALGSRAKLQDVTVARGQVTKPMSTRFDRITSVAREHRQLRQVLPSRKGRLLGRDSRQRQYRDAVETLHGLGFLLRDDGGWNPPTGPCAVSLITSRTHRFRGLGKLERRSLTIHADGATAPTAEVSGGNVESISDDGERAEKKKSVAAETESMEVQKEGGGVAPPKASALGTQEREASSSAATEDITLSDESSEEEDERAEEEEKIDERQC